MSAIAAVGILAAILLVGYTTQFFSFITAELGNNQRLMTPPPGWAELSEEQRQVNQQLLDVDGRIIDFSDQKKAFVRTNADDGSIPDDICPDKMLTYGKVGTVLRYIGMEYFGQTVENELKQQLAKRLEAVCMSIECDDRCAAESETNVARQEPIITLLRQDVTPYGVARNVYEFRMGCTVDLACTRAP